MQAMQRDDVVFHYGRQYLRAISRVTAPWVAAPRPPGYPKIRSGDLDEGWLVRVEPVVTELSIGFDELRDVVGSGPGRPFGKDGRPAQKYLSTITEAEAATLLDRIGAAAPGLVESADLMSLPLQTDMPIRGTARVEQAELRRHLLRSRSEAPCAVCRRVLPASLLVAAHVLPRTLLTDSERMDFEHVAVLMCVLGCDALYERGYLTVRDKQVKIGRPADTPAVADSVGALVGSSVEPVSFQQESLFAEHASLHLGGPSRRTFKR
ncbi:hypothetical protein [Curtobacterium caseinilyticum]|uniref:HNH endonuclease n=1 Tax=Curtobacterium caseinilyticum TaxID=3055137 RepID=A0ABT7TPA5_9MICO|nr:hypothetical protein [Curtobacterium caseinilyticum]MDM7891412.1 hypothetical protein [Curtobacterium caseinilyticum]